MVAPGSHAAALCLDLEETVPAIGDDKQLGRLAVAVFEEMRNCPLRPAEGCPGRGTFPEILVDQLRDDGLPTADVYADLSRISRMAAACQRRYPEPHCRVRPLIEMLLVSIGLRSHELPDPDAEPKVLVA